jgi:hypothetical protein
VKSTPEDAIYIKLGSPCDESWETMPRTGTARQCVRCRHKVHDLAALTPEEILALDSESGTLCGRIEWDAEGRINTRQGVAQAVLYAILGAAAPPYVAQALGAPPAGGQGETARIEVSQASGIYGIIREGDRPLSLADVTVSRHEDSKSAHTRTDESGAYSFKDLAPGSYQISFSKRDSAEAAGGQMERVDVCEGTMVQIDLRTDPAPRRVMTGLLVRPDPPQGRLTPGLTVLNLSVRSQNAGPVRNATVELVPHGDAVSKSVMAETDSGGLYYSFKDLSASGYQLKVSAPGFVTSTQSIQILADHSWRHPEVVLCPLTK